MSDKNVLPENPRDKPLENEISQTPTNGMMNYFAYQNMPVWPSEAKKLEPLFIKQREIFFEDRIKHINNQTPLSKNEIEDLRLLLLAGEHPNYISSRNNLDKSPELDHLKLQPINSDVGGYLLLLKMIWCSIWRDYQLRYREKLSSCFTLQQHKKLNCPFASNTLAETILSNDLEKEFKKADKILNIPTNVLDIENININNEGQFILDERLINYCKIIGNGKRSQALIDQIKNINCRDDKNLKLRIRLWQEPLYIYRCIADIFWTDKIKTRIESLQKKPPALTYLVHEKVTKPMRKGTIFDVESGKIIDNKGHELAVIDKESNLNIPSLDILTIQNILSPNNIKILNTVNAHRLLRWEVQTVTKQFIDNQIDARALKVIGGYEELAQRIGVGNNRRAAEQLRDIIVWQAAPRFYGKDGKHGNMLSFDYTPSGRGKKAVLTLVLGNMMLPHYVFELIGISQSKREERRLIPVVDMPPLIGRPNDQGAQASFQMEILVEMRKGAKDFVSNGGVIITKDRLVELADKVGLSKSLYPRVIDRWLHDGDDAPAFLKLIEEDCYALGEHFKKAQDFIIQAGKKEIKGSKAGKVSRAKKAILGV